MIDLFGVVVVVKIICSSVGQLTRWDLVLTKGWLDFEYFRVAECGNEGERNEREKIVGK